MKKNNLLFALLFLFMAAIPRLSSGQCTASAGATNATSCVCPTGAGTNCDLIPDITISQLPLTQSSNYTEYAQVCSPPCSGNDGRLRLGVSTPVIGFGPLETRGTSKYVCGTDTVDAGTVANIPVSCPITGLPVRQLVNQRIYHKNGNVMSYIDRPAGSMTYHASHGHQHIDDWGIYTLRTNNGDPNPANWPIIGAGTKLGFCLLDIGNCTSSNGYCKDTLGTTLTSTNIKNYGLGGGSYGCSNTVQGISNGYLDTYSQSLDGMWINIPPGLCNGTYYVVVQIDPYNYFTEITKTNNVIAVPITLTKQGGTVPVISASGATTFCSGSSVTLMSTPAANYLWSNGATTQSIAVSTAGTYSVTVNTSLSCPSTSAGVTVTVNNLTVNASAVSGAICAGQSTQLSVTHNASGTATVPVSFSTSAQVFIPDNNTTGVTSPIMVAGITPATLSSGMVVSVNLNLTHTYDGDLIVSLIAPSGNTINLSNRRGGSGDNFTNTTFSLSATTAIASGVAPFTGSYIPDASFNTLTGNVNGLWQLKVVDAAAQDTGRIRNWTLIINNQVATAPTFAWTSNPSGFTSSSQTPTVTPANNTSYNVVVTSANGCTGSSTVAVNVQQAPTVSVSPSVSICNGTSSTLTASGATNYTWSPTNGLNVATGNTVIASPTSTTTYTVSGTNPGCPNTGSNTVTVTINPNLTISVSPPISICNGSSTTLVAGGADSYSWSPTTGLSAGSGSSVTANPSSTTTYTVTGTSASGCSGSNQVTVTVNPNLTVSVSSSISICNGANTSLVAGGADSYTWSPSTGLSATSGNTVTANPSSTTTYTVTGTTNGCTGTNQVTVTVNPVPDVIVSPSSSICNGSSTVLNASGADSYSWSPATGLSSGSGDNVTANPASTTTYTLTGTTNGCTGTNQVTVTVNPVTVVTVTPSSSICNGASTSLNASGADSYSWSPTAGLSSGSGDNVIANPVSTTTYTVTGTTNGCTGTNQVTVTVNPVPVVTVTPSSSICNGASTSLNASGADSYSWSPTTGLSSGSGVNVIANPVSTTTYTVTGTTNGCTGTNQVTVTVNSNPIVGISSATTTLCSGQSTVLTASGANSYSWSPSTGLSTSSGSSVTANPTSTTTYTVIGTTGICTGSSSITLQVNTGSIPAQPNGIIGSSTACPGATVNYSVPLVTGAINYTWTFNTGATVVNGSGTNVIVATFSSAFTSASICVVANNNCGSSLSRCKTVSSLIPTRPSAINGELTGVCNTTKTYNTPVVTGATGYTWIIPAGITIIAGQGTGSVQLQFNQGFLQGDLCVVGYNSCGSGLSRCVTVKAAPSKPSSISGSSSVCANQAGVNYSVIAQTGATAYYWTSPSGSTIIGQGTNSVNINFGANAGNVGVLTGNSCASSGTLVKAITINCKLSDGSVISSPSLLISPNPVNDFADVEYITSVYGKYNLSVVDLTGRVIHSETIDIKGDITKISLNFDSLSKGVYLLSIDNNNDIKTSKKLIIQ